MRGTELKKKGNKERAKARVQHDHKIDVLYIGKGRVKCGVNHQASENCPAESLGPREAVHG
jgi:hypothetical protein